MLNTMIIYINKLATEARRGCEQENEFLKGMRNLQENEMQQVVESFGGKLEQISDDSMESNALISGTQDNFVIKYKNYHTIDILHELGHAFLHLEKKKKEKPLDGDYGLDETSASVFARAFLMPEYLFYNDVIENSINRICDIQHIADMYSTTCSDVITRGRELNLW